MRIRKIAILVGDYFEETEMITLIKALRNTKNKLAIISVDGEKLQSIKGIDKGKVFKPDFVLSDTDQKDYDVLILPGGILNAIKLRINEKAQSWAAEFIDSGRLVASSGYSSLLLISADLIEEKQIASPQEIKDDVKNAGGEWTSRPVVIAGNLITGNGTGNVEVFCRSILDWLN